MTDSSSSAAVSACPEWQLLLAAAAPLPSADSFAATVRQPLNWPALLAIAKLHNLLPLLAARLQQFAPDAAPPEICAKLASVRRAHAIFTLQLTSELFRLLDAFVSSSLEFLVTKGPVLSMRCYGDPGLRQYTDLDIIVRHRDITRATELMLQLGYQADIPLPILHKKIPGEYNFTHPRTHLLIEFHTEHTFRYYPRPFPIDPVFSRRASLLIDSRAVPALSVVDEFLLISIHGAKHFWERLMWIADVAALIVCASGADSAAKKQSHDVFDWNLLLAAAAEVRAERIVHLALVLASDLLGAALPPVISAAIRTDPPAARMAAQIETRLTTRIQPCSAHRTAEAPKTVPLVASALGDDTMRAGPSIALTTDAAFANGIAQLDPPVLSLLQRAAFRVQMRGGLLDGAAYLFRHIFH